MSVHDSITVPANVIDITDQQYGWLHIISFAELREGRGAYWLCECRCGTHTIVLGADLRQGHTTSCGCYQRERSRTANTRHGMHGKKIYAVWYNMKRRCSDPTYKHYALYGGRGITFFPPWVSFDRFFADIGDIPYQGATLDRIDSNAGYYPGNIQWSTPREQANNRRSNHFVTYNDETLTIAQWARKLSLNKWNISSRLQAGWDIEKALTAPINQRYAHRRKI